MNKKYQRFVEMNEEKRDDIIRATLKEFALYPYDAASINRILENANFSKGGLYHYFDGKKDLFIGVAEYILEYYLDEMKRLMKQKSGDILQRLVDCGEAQSIIGERYPYYTEFIWKLQQMNKDDMPADLKSVYEQVEEEDDKFLFEYVDESLFKDEISINEAILVIKYAMAGITKKEHMEGVEVLERKERLDHYAAQVFTLIDILRKLLYK